MADKEFDSVVKLVLSLMVVALAGTCMRMTNGDCGIGWGILGLFVIWKA